MRAPDLIIGPVEDPYMSRWHLFRKNGWQLALHRIHKSDDDRALHDHSGDNISLIVWGWYWERFSHAWEPLRQKLRLPFIPYFRKAEMPHRLVLRFPVWTLWLRWPARRNWGFFCPKGWLRWQDYVGQDYRTTGKSPMGKGCG